MVSLFRLSLMGLGGVPALGEILQHPVPGVVDERLRGVGEGVLVLDTDADVPVEHLGQGAGSQRIGALVEHQLLHDADAQAAGDHGQNGLVLLDGVLDPGPDLVVIENGLNLIIVALIQQDKRVLLQGLRRERLAARQRVVAGQDDLPLVPLEQPVIQILLRRGRQGDKAAVRLTVEDPVGDLVVSWRAGARTRCGGTFPEMS